MYGRFEAMGSRLLELFVPRIDASAAVSAAACGCRTYSSCWQCGGTRCAAYCCEGQGCVVPDGWCGRSYC